MPSTDNIRIDIGGNSIELSDIQSSGITINYALEDPENFQSKQSSTAADITMPATHANDGSFNSFHNPNIEDLTTGEIFKNPMPCAMVVNGVQIFKGLAILKSATHTDKPETYTVDCYGNSGDWLILMQNLTLWDCLNTTPHNFDKATVEASWSNFGSDEFHDYVYAPVRYRQPFGNNGGNLINTIIPDSMVTIYDLRPSLSIYWMLVRGFRQFGYVIQSNFINSDFFQQLVMPWTWGDFFDINSQITDAVRFKAAGVAPSYPPTGTITQIYPAITDAHTTLYAPVIDSEETRYIQSFVDITGKQNNFNIGTNYPPNGYDNYNLYSFDDITGTLSWIFNPPANLVTFIGSNITANFSLSLIVQLDAAAGAQIDLDIEITHLDSTGAIVSVVTNTVLFIVHGTVGSITSPTVYEFTVPNLNAGDKLRFRLKYVTSHSGGGGWAIQLYQSQYLNGNFTNTIFPTGTNPPSWALNNSTIELTGLYISVGAPVHFQFYDKFRSYNFLDLLGGLVDTFDLSIQTDPINKVVTIEPTYSYKLPNGTATPDSMDGYFTDKILDWSAKQDLSKSNQLDLYADNEMQMDFTFKQDGSDGGQNIYAGRYKGVYLNNIIGKTYNNTNLSNGAASAIPGSSRYLFPPRFQYGVRVQTNRFFAATMHYKAQQFAGISINGVAPQMCAIIPENVSNTSAADISLSFEPKIAFYKGLVDKSLYGGWNWGGVPGVDGPDTSKNLPFMFSVNYGHNGQYDPVLTYCDQNINGNLVQGLMGKFFLQRLATIRNGKLYSPWLRLNLNDITNWEHREAIALKGAVYCLISIDNYKPTTDETVQCKMWKITWPESVDVSNSFPSSVSVLTSPNALGQYDLKYAPLLLFTSDLPQ